MNIVLGILVLCILVIVHELGHFLAAKGFGVRVEKFSIGFGPVLLARRIGDTVYAISAIPFGGFVKMAGEHPEEVEGEGGEGAPEGGEAAREPRPGEFLAQHWLRRLVIVVAGPLMNLALALAANCLVGVFGYEVPRQPNVIGRAEPEAVAVGFLPGDRVVGVGSTSIESWHDFALALDAIPPGEAGEVRVERESGPVALAIPPGRAGAVSGALVPRAEPLVGEAAPGMPAYQAGLRSGDRVVAVNGTPVATWDAMRGVVNAHPDEEIPLEFERGGKRFSTPVRPVASEDPATRRTIGLIGVSPPSQLVTLGPGESILAGLSQTAGMILVTYKGFWDLVTKPREAMKQIAGPITIAQIAGESASRTGVLLTRAAFISVALMALNLLPIPILDGGTGLFCVIEGLRGRAVSLRSQYALQKVGLVVLGSLLVFALVNDSLRVGERLRSRPKPVVEEPATAPGAP